jgi:diaminohydroxyphosphoribosylaminopyrimidine deaminase/5-amino-6-(5-phosphoribosylamino)uracil reductase
MSIFTDKPEDLKVHHSYMQRCFDLARRGAGSVSPNPLVGAVVVHRDRILSEGFHRSYGGAHAEREAIRNVRPGDLHLLPESILYVSLEPCCHFGKTPPCAELIIESGIRQVVVSSQDPNPLVSGKGLETLRSQGVNVLDQILQPDGDRLIRRFTTYITKNRPHIILKIVQSSDGFIGKEDTQVWLSNEYERVMVHKIRSEIDAIMVGTNTAIVDDPELTTRHFPGRNPIRIILDRRRRIPAGHSVLAGNAPTILFTEVPAKEEEVSTPYQVVPMTFGPKNLEDIMAYLHTRKIQSILVEGGAALVSDFLRLGLWDEALVVRTPKELKSGVKAPLIEGMLQWRYLMAGDEILSIEPGRQAL